MKKKVFQDIEESTYFSEYGRYRFYFSSYYNMNHFERDLPSFIKQMDEKFKGQYGHEIDTRQMSVFKFYWRIEKRGFRVYNIEEGDKRIWQNQIKFVIVEKMNLC